VLPINREKIDPPEHTKQHQLRSLGLGYDRKFSNGVR
jgi:hypothetical protein